MQTLTHDQQGIITILTQLYRKIEPVESTYDLVYGGKDFRARIEHFHDPIRALTSQDRSAIEAGGCLTLEWLTFDVEALRYIQAYPLALLDLNNPTTSSSKDIITAGTPPLRMIAKLPRDVRADLTEWYKEYSILFVALFKPYADRDFLDRAEVWNEQIEQLAALEQYLKQGVSQEVAVALNELDDPVIKDAMDKIKQLKGKEKQQTLATVMQRLQLTQEKLDKNIKEADDAHKNYAMQQLMLYENAKDVVKSFAVRGMPVVGQFVEGALTDSTRDRGPGR